METFSIEWAVRLILGGSNNTFAITAKSGTPNEVLDGVGMCYVFT